MKNENYKLEEVVEMVNALDKKLDYFIQRQEEINKRNDNKSFDDFLSDVDVERFRKIHRDILNVRKKVEKQISDMV